MNNKEIKENRKNELLYDIIVYISIYKGNH